MISWFPLVLIALTIGCLALCYWGAGIILHPPSMSPMLVFPEQFGLRYESIYFKTVDGLTLKGWFIPSPTGNERTLLMCHGWGDNKGELLKSAYFLNASAGFNLLFFDNRSHGESEGEFTTIGYLENRDFDAAMDYLRTHRPQCLKHLGVFGFSMGAAVATISTTRHHEIKATVLESPFTDYRRVVRQWTWNNFHLPYFPLIQMVLWMLRWRVGHADVDDYDPIRFINRIAPRPLLLIGGSLDKLMPETGVRQMYAAAGDPKQLWIVAGATHGECHKVAGLEYETIVANFFNRHL